MANATMQASEIFGSGTDPTSLLISFFFLLLLGMRRFKSDRHEIWLD